MTRKSGPARRTARSRPPVWRLTRAQQAWLLGLVLLAVALLTLLSLLSSSNGQLTGLWLSMLRRIFGWGVYAVPFGLGVAGAWVIALGLERPWRLPWTRVTGAVLLCGVGLTLFSLLFDVDEAPLAGGQIGWALSQTLVGALGLAGTGVVLIMLLGIALTLLVDVSWGQVAGDLLALLRRVWGWLRARRWPWHGLRVAARREPLPMSQPTPTLTVPAETNPWAALVPSTPAAGSPSTPVAEVHLVPGVGGERVPWILPRMEDILAESSETPISVEDIRAKVRKIEETLGSLGVPVTVVEVNPGPVVTQFGLEPGYVERRDRDGQVKRVKVKVSRIAALANDLALALAASPIRIETPVPGKGVVGLEIPNSEPTVVGLRGVLEAEQYQGMTSKLALGLGRDVSGTAVVDDLAELPHLLIAGATGSGKSVCINAFIACLLLRNTPDDLRLIMIDPKRVELSNYNGIPHLLAPVVVDAERVVGVLHWVAREMDRRYKAFARVGARNLQAYNDSAWSRGEPKLPMIVVFVDELADLMMVAPDEVERSLCRIAQMARATGIHLVVATQRPSVDVVTGLIKANFPARLSFAVSSQIDSRVILDTPGADKLLGRGDALYMAPDSPKLMRIQGCYVHDAELARLVAFWRAQPAQRAPTTPPAEGLGEALEDGNLVQSALWPDMSPAKPSASDEDPLLNDAIALLVGEKRASVSYLQRRLRIGYTRAARLIDILEAKGIVGPAVGTSKIREVLRSSATRAEEASQSNRE